MISHSHSPRAGGLTFSRFLIACLLAGVVGTGLHFVLTPRPLWSISFKSLQHQYSVIEEHATQPWLLVLERINLQYTSILILNTATGRLLHRLETPVDMNDFWGLQTHGHYPRMIGETVWRFVRVVTEDGVSYQLRRWDFTSATTEQVVKTWNTSPDTPFEVTFAPDNAPYFLVQTTFPWEPALVLQSVDGWSALTHLLAKPTIAKDPRNSTGRLSGISLTEPEGTWLPWLQSYALPTTAQPSLTPLANWTLPLFRWTWPLQVGPNLSWIACGDSLLPVKWESSMKRRGYPNRDHVLPAGVLLYQGHTGQPMTIPFQPYSKPVAVRTDSLGDVLRISQEGGSKGFVELGYQYAHVSTGKLLHWPKELTHPHMLSFDLDAVHHPSQPERWYFHQNSEKPQSGGMLILDSITQVQLRDGQFQLVDQTQLVPDGGENPFLPTGWSYITDDTIICDAQSAKHSFHLLRSVVTAPAWYEKYLHYVFPPVRSEVRFYDRRTGLVVGSLPNRYAQPTNLQKASRTLITCQYATTTDGFPKYTKTLEGWKLPIRFYHRGWRIAAGLVVFLLMLWFLGRRRPKHEE
ncbi:MAG: hypothetical protein U0796_05520 [Gemmatales bacterium]